MPIWPKGGLKKGTIFWPEQADDRWKARCHSLKPVGMMETKRVSHQ